MPDASTHTPSTGGSTSSADPTSNAAAHASTFAPGQARALIRAVFAIFLANGVMIGAWGGSMPGLRDRVGTDAGGIGILLLVTGASAIVSMQIGGRLADSMTPRLPSLVSGVFMSIGMLVAAFAPSYAALLLAGVLIGASNGTMDVAMNTLAVDAEQASGRPIMSRFHAFFSLGGFLGALVVMAWGRALGDGADPRAALLTAAVASALTIAALFPLTPKAPHAHEADDDGPTSERKMPAQAWLLGVMALFFGFTEGTAIDWASIHVTDVTHVDPSVGAAGLVCVSATMVVIRLLGDALVTRYGRVAVVRFGAPVAVAGFLLTVVSSSFGVIIAGWLLVGLGVGMIAPQIYAIAGHIGGGRVLAIVTGFGYTAFLAGPGLIGFLSHEFGIQRAMILPLAAGSLLTVMTFTAALREPKS